MIQLEKSCFCRWDRMNYFFGMMILFLVISPVAFSQDNFIRYFNNPGISQYSNISSAHTISGDGVVVATQSVAADSGILILKINYDSTPGFTRLFNRNFGGNQYPLVVTQLMCTSDSLITIFGHDIGFPLILKVSMNGTLISARRFSQGDMRLVKLHEIDGFLYALGSCNNTQQGGCVVKMDLDGNIISTFAHSHTESQRQMYFSEISKMPDGGFLLAGEHSNTMATMNDKLILLRTDSSFNVQWQKHYSINGTPVHYDMIPAGMELLPGGGALLIVNNSVNSWSRIMTTDSLGNITAFHGYYTGWPNESVFLFGLFQQPNGNFITGGQVYSQNFGTHAFPFAAELDDAGNFVREVVFQKPLTGGSFVAKHATFNADRGLLLSCSQATTLGQNRILVYDTDSLLESVCIDSVLSTLKVNYTASDSIFVFPMLSVSRTNTDYTSFISVVTPPLLENDFCNTTGLDDGLSLVYDFKLFPNPAVDEAVIEWESNNTSLSEQTHLQISSPAGEVIDERVLSPGKTTLDTSNLSSGLYFLVFTTSEGTAVKKLVVTR